MKKNGAIAALLVFCSSQVFCQPFFESTASFDTELINILSSINNKNVEEINFMFKMDMPKGSKEKRYTTDRMVSRHMNDSVVELHYYRRNYYYLIRKGNLINYDFTKGEVIKYNSPAEYDSAGYKVSYSHWVYNTDSATWYNRSKSDSITGSSENITNNPKYPSRLYKWEKHRDTKISENYTMKNDKWVMLLRTINTIEMSGDLTNSVETNTTTRYDQPSPGENTTSIHITKGYYAYDHKKRLVRAEKYDYMDNDKWYNKHIMMVEYEEK